jgi:hypothetical protein
MGIHLEPITVHLAFKQSQNLERGDILLQQVVYQHKRPKLFYYDKVVQVGVDVPTTDTKKENITTNPISMSSKTADLFGFDFLDIVDSFWNGIDCGLIYGCTPGSISSSFDIDSVLELLELRAASFGDDSEVVGRNGNGCGPEDGNGIIHKNEVFYWYSLA